MPQSPEEWVAVAVAIALVAVVVRLLMHLAKIAIWALAAVLLAMALSTMRPAWLPDALVLPGFEHGEPTAEGWRSWLDPGNWRALLGLGVKPLTLEQLRGLSQDELQQRLQKQMQPLPSPLPEDYLARMSQEDLVTLSSLLGQTDGNGWLPGELAKSYEEWGQLLGAMGGAEWQTWASAITPAEE